MACVLDLSLYPFCLDGNFRYLFSSHLLLLAYLERSIHAWVVAFAVGAEYRFFDSYLHLETRRKQGVISMKPTL